MPSRRFGEKAGEEAGQVCHMAERSNRPEVLLGRRGSPPLDRASSMQAA